MSLGAIACLWAQNVNLQIRSPSYCIHIHNIVTCTVFPYRFAAEVFHNLYEEVINTASRGHKLLLQVQQLETDLKSIGFSSESASSCLSYKQGYLCFLKF